MSIFDNSKSENVDDSVTVETEFFVATLSNGNEFNFFKSSEFKRGVYVPKHNSHIFAIGNDELVDDTYGVVFHEELFSHDGAVKLVRPSGESFEFVNPAHIVSVSGPYRVTVNVPVLD